MWYRTLFAALFMATAARQTACFRPEATATRFSLSLPSRGASRDGRVATPVANGVKDLVDSHLILQIPMPGFEGVSQLHGANCRHRGAFRGA